VLTVCPRSFQIERNIVALRTLKRRIVFLDQDLRIKNY
jgi:hypothetical protein